MINATSALIEKQRSFSPTRIEVSKKFIDDRLSATADRRRGEKSAGVETRRPRVAGKFLYVGREKFWVRGVTYGAFRPGPDGQEYHDPAVLERDFSLMAANGLNAVRIPHTMPPRHGADTANR